MRRFVFLCIVGMLFVAPTACAQEGSAPTPDPSFPPVPPSDNDDTYVPMNYYY